MHSSVRYACLAGAVVAAAIGVAGAAFQAPRPAAHRANQQTPAQTHRRSGSRFLAEYDLNKDGKKDGLKARHKKGYYAPKS